MRTPLTRLVLILTTALALGACSGEATPTDEGASPSESTSSAAPDESEEPTPTETPESDATVIEIRIEGDSLDPNGERVEIPLGDPVMLRITADRSGELHVHSTPEQVLEFKKGTHEIELSLDQPGVVEVEEHESGNVIVQLQVS